MPLFIADSGERRYQQFDGLRAFAVLAVIYHHWVWNVLSTDAYNRWYHYIFKVSLGGLGVKIFFVLSGFLIQTRIETAFWQSPIFLRPV